MDEIELLVSETFKHFHQTYGHENEFTPINRELPPDDGMEIPSDPGVIYHIQKTTSVFVIRTFVSKNIKEDYLQIMADPGNYPSLRLLEGGDDNLAQKLKFFVVENNSQAEVVHDQLCNRRFPKNEELMCNLSDPGFSWWLSYRNQGFQLAFTLSVGFEDGALKLGPLGDQQLAQKSFQKLQHFICASGLTLNVQNEVNRVQFSDGDQFLIEELKDLFEFGVMNDGLKKLFKLMAKQGHSQIELETLWFYLQEVAALRRFWIQIQYDINS